MINLIKDAKKLRTAIRGALTTQATLHDKFQNTAVSSVWHAATHGDPSRLNELYSGMSATYQASFKRWVAAEVAKLYPEGTKSSEFWLALTKDVFTVKRFTTDERLKFVAMVDEAVARSAAKDATKAELAYGRFFEMDPTKVPNLFDDAALTKKLYALLKSATKDDSNVSSVGIDGLKKAIHEFTKVTGLSPDTLDMNATAKAVATPAESIAVH